ncbi:protein SHORT-ROOT-like [Canna indica]|uniref:Protein SHORT-ROOT-like n=1 Tax=Canna indica TaxID=4628 RepID=A0AAQ3QJ31_9LILI|nr:protein SHORT-ROOT-like [Canna indica]
MQNPQHRAPDAFSLDLDDPTAADKWAAELLRECAKAIADKDSANIHRLMWMLNELASPYGDCEQRLASYFLQALFCKATDSAAHCYRTSLAVAEKTRSFDSARKVILKFQESSPWTTFGHVAANGAIMEAFEGEAKLHIVDISNTFCTQWPTLMEALATRADDTPHLRLTVVATSSGAGAVMEEIGQRMEKFARLMGVPFEFQVVRGLARLEELGGRELLGLREGEAVAVNCVGALRLLRVDERDAFLRTLAALRPRVVTVVEEEADFTSCKGDFVECFDECLRFYGGYFGMLEESFPATSNERLALERECFRGILSVLALDGDDEVAVGDCERREKGRQWCGRLAKAGGFSAAEFSEDVVDDLKALLRRYQAGWSLMPAEGNAAGVYLTWKQEAVVWACAWKPN